MKEKLQKIKDFKKSFPIEILKEEKKKLENLTFELKDYKNKKKFLNSQLISKKEEIKILDQVPCGDKFLNCKFINNAYESKNDIPEIDDKIKNIETSIYEIQSVVNKLEKNELSNKIEKYNDVLNKEYKSKIDIDSNEDKIKRKTQLLEDLKFKKNKTCLIIDELKSYDDIVYIDKLNSLKTDLNSVQNKIFDIESDINKTNKEIFQLENNLLLLVKEEENYNKIIEEWKIYDLYSHAVSKKGIPTMLISSFLPKINKEIDTILTGVTSFKIKILDDENNNNLNVYIDYGDSIRIIECASGMEKMMASIAIRVALTNISSLPKSDIFIIDEGFGALDDTNIEACARLLKSLKKYFKTILIISHIDSIKDIVDKNIEVTIKGKDSYVEYK